MKVFDSYHSSKQIHSPVTPANPLLWVVGVNLHIVYCVEGRFPLYTGGCAYFKQCVGGVILSIQVVVHTLSNVLEELSSLYRWLCIL